MTPYTGQQVQAALKKLHHDWISVDNKLLQLHARFDNFDESMSFVNHVAKLANKADHHPDIHIHFDKVIVELWTHDVNGITDKDVSLASQIEHIL